MGGCSCLVAVYCLCNGMSNGRIVAGRFASQATIRSRVVWHCILILPSFSPMHNHELRLRNDIDNDGHITMTCRWTLSLVQAMPMLFYTVSQCNLGCCTGIVKFANCSACPIGFYQNDKDQSNCIECNLEELYVDAKTTCRRCDIGRFGSSNGNCSACPSGFYQDSKGKEECRDSCDVLEKVPNEKRTGCELPPWGTCKGNEYLHDMNKDLCNVNVSFAQEL